MRGPDAALFLAVLILVPALAWVLGRAAGRRDWTILPVVGGAAVLALAIEGLAIALRMLLLAPAVVPARAGDSLMPIEPAAFLIVLSIFMAVLGWSSVPAVNKQSNV
jgi:hypothetical protein